MAKPHNLFWTAQLTKGPTIHDVGSLAREILKNLLTPDDSFLSIVFWGNNQELYKSFQEKGFIYLFNFLFCFL